ncbi:MAG: cupin domain-containing protein [Bryobacterales bacterium]|nr:cupin domain-containing protein [Bryobacterales bacterium]
MAVYLKSYRDPASFRPERFNPVLLGGSANMKAVLTCLEPGQFIPVHRPGVDMLLVVLEGEGRVVAGEREEAAQPGTTVFVPAGEARGLKAESRLLALHVVSPPPTDADHVEVAARLKQGTWK